MPAGIISSGAAVADAVFDTVSVGALVAVAFPADTAGAWTSVWPVTTGSNVAFVPALTVRPLLFLAAAVSADESWNVVLFLVCEHETTQSRSRKESDFFIVSSE